MLKGKKWLFFMVGLILLSTGFPGTAHGASKRQQETRIPIETLTVTMKSAVRVGDYSAYLKVTQDSDACSVGNYEWSGMKNASEGWQIGDKPKVKVSFHARSGYYFNKTNGKGKVTVNGAEYNSARIADNKETLIVTVTLPTVSGIYDNEGEAWWDGIDASGLARWDAISGITAYELALYRDDSKILELEKVIGTSYDFYPYMTQEGRYYYSMRGIPRDSKEAAYIIPTEWIYSDVLYLKTKETPGRRYGWNSSYMGGYAPVYGWQFGGGGWWFCEQDGSYPKNTWKVIDGKWYLFDAAGYILTGWQNWKGRSFYLNEDGTMRTGWYWDDRNWYYLDQDGAALKGWNTIDGKTYYMNEQCAAVSGWWQLEGKWYYFDKKSRQLVRDAWVNGYYIDSSGEWKP